jgi:hypothetical protein
VCVRLSGWRLHNEGCLEDDESLAVAAKAFQDLVECSRVKLELLSKRMESGSVLKMKYTHSV